MRSSFLSILKEKLPNLEKLWIATPSDINRAVRFEAMKKFTLNALRTTSSAIVPVEFGDKMEELIILWGNDPLGEIWIKFIESNENIQKLTMSFPFRVMKGCPHYAYLGDLKLKHLRTLELHFIDVMISEEMDSFVNKIKQFEDLKEVRFSHIWLNETNVVKDKLGDEWKMTTLESETMEDRFDVTMTKA